MEYLRLLLFDKAEAAVEQNEVGKQSVQVTVKAEQEELTKVPVIEVSHDVKEEPLDFPKDRLVCRWKFLTVFRRKYRLVTHRPLGVRHDVIDVLWC